MTLTKIIKFFVELYIQAVSWTGWTMNNDRSKNFLFLHLPLLDVKLVYDVKLIIGEEACDH